jgi:hypothetical protein
MKVSMFHRCRTARCLRDFEYRYHSVWVDLPWGELADAETAGRYYNWTFDELLYAPSSGSTGSASTSTIRTRTASCRTRTLWESVLARLTSHLDVAIVQMGATLPSTQPPTRNCEEYAMIDCISSGRLVAGMPIGKRDGR